MTVVVGGKQKRVERPPLVEGMTVDEFIRASADAVWLHLDEMWKELAPFADGRSEGSPNDEQDEADQESKSA